MPATARGPAGDASVGAQHAAPLPGDSGSRTAPRYADVVLPIPVPRTYTYLIPPELGSRVVPGARVVVPVQRRQVVGVVAAVGAGPPGPPVAAKAILAASRRHGRPRGPGPGPLYRCATRPGSFRRDVVSTAPRPHGRPAARGRRDFGDAARDARPDPGCDGLRKDAGLPRCPS